jgi:hypothetical protein
MLSEKRGHRKGGDAGAGLEQCGDGFHGSV